MKLPALQYRYEHGDWRAMPPAVARDALSNESLTPVDEVAPQFSRLLAGHEISAVSASGRDGFIRIAR